VDETHAPVASGFTEQSRSESVDVLGRLAEDVDDGFAGLVRSEERVVYSVALRITGRHADAEDLTAETFLRAYRALLGYSTERVLELKVRSWLITITLNIWRNSIRDASRRPDLVPTADVPDRGTDQPAVEQAVESAETQRELGVLLTQLSTPQRLAVVLRHVAGLSMTEVADALACSEGTAKSHVSRALTKLRARYHASPLPHSANLVGRRGC
jgi:RNA polymerase sigma-70 factor (ECF subfamily)